MLLNIDLMAPFSASIKVFQGLMVYSIYVRKLCLLAYPLRWKQYACPVS